VFEVERFGLSANNITYARLGGRRVTGICSPPRRAGDASRSGAICASVPAPWPVSRRDDGRSDCARWPPMWSCAQVGWGTPRLPKGRRTGPACPACTTSTPA